MVRDSKLVSQDGLRKVHLALSAASDGNGRAKSQIRGCSENELRLCVKHYASQVLLHFGNHKQAPRPALVHPDRLFHHQDNDLLPTAKEPVPQGRGKGGRPTWRTCEHGMLCKRGPDRFVTTFDGRVSTCFLCP